jgi:hypothetical protein
MRAPLPRIAIVALALAALVAGPLALPAAAGNAHGSATTGVARGVPAAVELIGGYPYDRGRDRGCADCGPNGRPERYGDRARRWARDCLGTAPACATRELAERDAVERLYSELRARRVAWGDSGFLAEPAMAGSRHHCPDYWAGQARGCTAAGGAEGAGGAGGSTGAAAGLAQGLLAGLDVEALLTALLRGLWELLVGDGIAAVGDEIAAFLLATPDLLATEGGMANVQGVVDALRLAALGACLVMFAATAAHFAAGREEAPQAALGRLLAVMVGLGFYRTFVGWLLRGAHELAFGIQAIGADTTTGVFTAALKALVPAAAPFWYILSIIGSGLVIAVGVVKILGLAFLLLTYAAGPILLPLAIHPRTAGWVGLWAEHLVKALLWPALWALQFRLFGAIAGGLTFVDSRGNVNLGVGALGALTSLAMLVIMAGTPWTLHTRFTVARYGQFVVRQAGRAVDAAALVATGGASWSVKGAAALALRQRSASQAAKSRQAGNGD